jgi:hypothetical protein
MAEERLQDDGEPDGRMTVAKWEDDGGEGEDVDGRMSKQ